MIGVKESLIRFAKWFREKEILKLLAVYGVCNILLLIVWIQIEQLFTVNLELKPPMDPPSSNPQSPEAFLPIALTLLPLTLLFEDLGIRLMPEQLFSLTGVKKRLSPRFYAVVYIVVSATFHTVLHQVNIINADPIGRLGYLLIQGFAGCYLALVFYRKGFWAAYTIHVFWDYLIITVSLLAAAFQLV